LPENVLGVYSSEILKISEGSPEDFRELKV
jgi:hypothetical protein